MLEQPSDYLLPAIELRWWNVHSQKIDRAYVDAVDLPSWELRTHLEAHPKNRQFAGGHS
jgi:hypothetical protein